MSVQGNPTPFHRKEILGSLLLKELINVNLKTTLRGNYKFNNLHILTKINPRKQKTKINNDLESYNDKTKLLNNINLKQMILCSSSHLKGYSYIPTMQIIHISF